jgi:hypothetical protein
VQLNGQTVCVFDHTNLYPGRGGTAAPTFIGLQVHAAANALVAYRRIRIKAL